MINYETAEQAPPAPVVGPGNGLPEPVELSPAERQARLLMRTLDTGRVAGGLAVSEARREEMAKKTVEIYIPATGELGSIRKDTTMKQYGGLDDMSKVLIAAAQVRSNRYDDIYDTEEKRRAFVLRMVNKGKFVTAKNDHPELLDEAALKELYDRAVEEGKLVRKGPKGTFITEAGVRDVRSHMKRWKNSRY